MKPSAELPLPPSFDALLRTFDVIDRIGAFLAKRSVQWTVQNLSAMVKSASADDDVALRQRMLQLASLAPQLVALRWAPRRAAEDGPLVLEYAYLQRGSAAKRRFKLRKAMVERLCTEHDRLAPAVPSALFPAAKKRKRKAKAARKPAKPKKRKPPLSWRPDFDVRSNPALTVDALVGGDQLQPPPCPAVAEAEPAVHHDAATKLVFARDGDLVAGAGDGSGGRGSSSEESVASSATTTKPGPAAVVSALRESPFYDNQIVYVKEIAARSASFAELEQPLDARVARRVAALTGGAALWSHQARAINAARAGHDVAVCTATASGKSLCYVIPILEAIVIESRLRRDASALVLFPTKALAQDQLRALREMVGDDRDLAEHVSCAALDGDTPHADRDEVRDKSTVVLSNPDFVHHLLAHHTRWERFFGALKFIVVDEAHVYRGVFGSHVAAVLSRLVRVCASYGARPTFVCTSATMADPARFVQTLIGAAATRPSAKGVVVVADDGSPSGLKQLAVWNPPFKLKKTAAFEHNSRRGSKKKTKKKKRHNHAAQSVQEPAPAAASSAKGGDAGVLLRPGDGGGDRRSAIFETALLLAAFVRSGVRTLAFAKSRKLVELILRHTQRLLRSVAPETVSKVMAYRGGYTKSDRREIERSLFSGDLLGVVATSALEVGVDIGCLDATLHLGFPGSMSSLWQQVGRAGRSATRGSLAILILFDSPLDQYLAAHAPTMLARRAEAVTLDPANEFVLRAHLLVAAAELPLLLSCADVPLGVQNAPQLKQLVAPLLAEGKLVRTADRTRLRAHASAAKGAAGRVSLRMIDSISFSVRVNGREIDTLPYSRAFFELHPNAVYLHQGKTYVITGLDLERHTAAAVLSPSLTYRTQPRDHTDCMVTQRQRVRGMAEEASVCFGNIRVRASVWGYRKVDNRTGRIIGMGEFSLPPLELNTRAMWIQIAPSVRRRVEAANREFIAAVHAAEHALTCVLPLFIACDRADTGTEHIGPYRERRLPSRLVLYDKRPGGVAEEAFERIAEIAAAALALVRDCACQSGGCPSCVHDGRCPEHNYMVDKQGGAMILAAIVGALAREKGEGEGGGSATGSAETVASTSSGKDHDAAFPSSPAHVRSSAMRGADVRVTQSWIASQPLHVLEAQAGAL